MVAILTIIIVSLSNIFYPRFDYGRLTEFISADLNLPRTDVQIELVRSVSTVLYIK